MRIFIGFAFFLVYLVWVVYHLAIKKDMKRQLTNLYVFTFFIVVWLGIYYYIFI